MIPWRRKYVSPFFAPRVTVRLTKGSTTWTSPDALHAAATRSGGHAPRGSHNSRTQAGRSIRPKNDAMFNKFSSVGRKLAGHWNRMAVAPKTAAQDAVTRHPSSTIPDSRNAPASDRSRAPSDLRRRR